MSMKVEFTVPFVCDAKIHPYLQKVFSGEYDVPVQIHGAKIIDLGANCGSFSVWATHRFPGSTIYAYEPHPETFKILEKNTERYPNIKIHNFGVGAPGLRALHNGKNNCGEASFHAAIGNDTPTGQHLEVHPPSDLPPADIIKLDIEGCEMEVLGPLITEGRKFDLIMLEWHNHRLRREVDDLLSDYYLIGGVIENPVGRGVFKYMRKDLMPGLE